MKVKVVFYSETSALTPVGGLSVGLEHCPVGPFLTEKAFLPALQGLSNPKTLLCRPNHVTDSRVICIR